MLINPDDDVSNCKSVLVRGEASEYCCDRYLIVEQCNLQPYARVVTGGVLFPGFRFLWCKYFSIRII